MRAVSLGGFGDVEVLRICEVPRAVLVRECEVLIRVMAAGVNRADVAQRRGLYPPPKGSSEVLGLEVSGIVEQVGSDVGSIKVGDRVMALLSGGGYAEYAVAHAGCVMAIPTGYSFVEAAAIPESFLTAWQALKLHGDVQKGQHVLIHAGASGVGVAASQLVEKCFKATAVTTSSLAKVECCKRFASISLDRVPDEAGLCFASKIKNLLGEGCINVVVDPVFGNLYTAENAAVLADDGRIVVLSFLGGSRVEMDFLPLFQRRAHLIFSMLRNQSDDYKSALVRSFTEEAMPYLCERAIEPVVTQTFPLEEVALAHRLVESNELCGKVVLTF